MAIDSACGSRSPFSMDDRRIFKMWFALGIMFFVFVTCACIRVFAYDTYEIYPQVVWVDESTQNWRMASDPDYPDSAFYSPVGGQTKEIGYLCGYPVPYYADGDHVSVFVDFSIAVPAEALQKQQWVGLFVRPINSNNYLSTATNTGNGEWLRVNILNQGNLAELYTGSFHWEGMDAYCSYKLLVTYAGDGSASVTNSFIYHVTGVLDLNLVQSTKELKPFLLTAKYYLGYPANNVSNYGLSVSKDYHFRITDTSMMGAIEDLKNTIDEIDLSGLSDLGDLTTVINNWYEDYSLNIESISDQLESIYDDGETDPDITQWAERASEFESQNQYLHSLEDDLMGTVGDFTFPDVPDASSSIVGHVVLPWFENPIVIALVMAGLAMMIVFAIL